MLRAIVKTHLANAKGNSKNTWSSPQRSNSQLVNYVHMLMSNSYLSFLFLKEK